MASHLDALRSSVQHLHDVVAPLGLRRLEEPAYPQEWTIADVLSHVGSGAVIMQRRLADALAGQPTPDDFAPSTWDEWNAKQPRAKADDALTADRELLGRLDGLTGAERAGFRLAMGPIAVDFDGFVGLRLNEHALHTWDIEVALDPDARVRADAAALVVDNLGLIARYTGKPTGTSGTVTVRTTDPARWFAVDLDAVSMTALDRGERADLTLPAEALVRLVYGRLDAAHTPRTEGDPQVLEELRRAFPGP
jgi:uncharacterized protein (TIGR03083 family)